jgi:O-antigen/teichoic acid export membrane protein
MKRLGGIAALLSAAAFFVGLWFFFTEHDFAKQQRNDLAAKLQWIGVGLAVLGAAGFLLGIYIGYSDED